MLATLIQPCFRKRRGQAYLPNNLLFLAGRLMEAGFEVEILDEAVGHTAADINPDSDFIGIGVVGPPYIPQVQRLLREIRHEGHRQEVLIGGQTITRMTEEHFEKLFFQMGSVVRIASDEDLRTYLGPEAAQKLPKSFDARIDKALELLDDRSLYKYFSKEWCLYVSDGCAYNCNFCAASKGRKEQFLREWPFVDNITALAKLVSRYGGPNPRYEIYLSTLDGFQTPKKMEWVLKTAHHTMTLYEVRAKFRCLATSKCVHLAMKKDPDLLKRWRDYGLTCVGIGVDGDKKSWERENKNHNDQAQIEEVFAALQAADIQPEALMVMGLPKDTPLSLIKTVHLCQELASQGISVRPYLGKDAVPGSHQWTEDEHGIVRQIIARPELFSELDYSCLATSASHPERRQRLLANLAYVGTCAALKLRKVGCPTNPIMPTSSMPPVLREIGKAWNRFIPGDR